MAAVQQRSRLAFLYCEDSSEHKEEWIPDVPWSHILPMLPFLPLGVACFALNYLWKAVRGRDLFSL